MPATTTSTPTTTTLTPTTTTLAATTSTTSTTQPGPPPTCLPSHLKLVAVKSFAAAGSIYSPVDVVNTSTASCSLDGRPDVSLIGAMQGATPAPLPTTVQTKGQESAFSVSPSLLTLPPTGVAAVGFLVQSSDVPTDGEQTCPVVSSMSVILPGVSSALSVSEAFTACGGPTISVSAIVTASAVQPG
ncbi:MAG: DUF4232 domain-containing protein [Acidimicrobiales bacterium]